MKFRCSSWLYIILFSLFMGVVFAIRCYNREPSGDELLYQYVWEEDDDTDLWEKGHRFERKVSSWGDIWQTQVKHYMLVNGRALVHTVEQAFTGHMMAFTIINTCVFLLFVWLIVCYVAPRDKRGNFLLWLAVYISLLVLFPYQESLWISVNYGLNYLWPATMAVAVLILWDKILAGEVPAGYNIPIAVLAFVFGWTHEAFVVGVGGGMFIYYCCNFSRFRGQILVLAIPMWISAAIMLFSPGNISRFFGDSGDTGTTMFLRIGNGIGYVIESIPLMMMILGSLLLTVVGKRRELGLFIKTNSRLFTVMTVALLFSVALNTRIHSLSCANLIALLIVFRYLCSIKWYYSRLSVILTLIIAICFMGQQIILAKDTIEHYRLQHYLIKDYISNNDGLIHYSTSEIAPTSYPFIRTWDKPLYEVIYLMAYNSVYGEDRNEPRQVSDSDIYGFKNQEAVFDEKYKIEGNAPVYHIPGAIYFMVDSTKLKSGQTLVADLYPVDFNHRNVELAVKLKFLLFPDSYDSHMSLEVDTIESSRYGRLMLIKRPSVRKIKAIFVEQ